MSQGAHEKHSIAIDHFLLFYGNKVYIFLDFVSNFVSNCFFSYGKLLVYTFILPKLVADDEISSQANNCACQTSAPNASERERMLEKWQMNGKESPVD